MNIATPPVSQRDEWLQDIQEKVDSCQSMQELRIATSIVWDLRNCDGVVPHSLGMFRARAQQLQPGYNTRKIVAVDFNSVVNTGIHISVDAPRDMMRTIARKTGGDCTILCADGSNVHRYKAMDQYKESRPEDKPDGFMHAWDLALGQDSLCIDEEHEADDLLATIAFQCQVLAQPVTLVSKDSDMWQCLGLQTSIYDFGKRPGKFIGAPWLKATHRINAKQVVDWMCLCGGKNDVPGCKGIGRKTASDLIEAYGSVCGIWDHRDTLTPKKKESFEDFFNDHYWTVREIHTLKRNCCIPGRFFNLE